MNFNSIKAIITDLDRTLLCTDKSVSEHTNDVLKRCKERGIKLMAATARPERTAVPYSEIIGFDAMVLSNGARVICGTKKWEFPISTDSAMYLLDTLQKYRDIPITIETGDMAYSNIPIADYETALTSKLAEVILSEGAMKILFHLEEESSISRILTDDLYYTVSNGYLMQVMDRTATKWNGILLMLKSFGISPSEAIYFGDDFDDIEPLKNCGIGVAVANAINEAASAADFICGTNDTDGVANFLEKHLL